MANYKIDIIPVFNDNYVFIFTCLKTRVTACIDPADSKPVTKLLEQQNLKLDYILNTHHHFDHVGGNKTLKAKFNCKIAGFSGDEKRIPEIDIKLNDQDNIQIGSYEFKILFVPGHTKGHIAYYSKEAKALFVGDTLFSSGCGRLFEGTAEEMYKSLAKIKKLPKDTQIYCAHEYTLANIKFALSLEPNNKKLIAKKERCIELRKKELPTIPTNLQEELETNPFLRTLDPELRKNSGKTTDSYHEEVFARIRKMKDNF